MPRLSGTHRKPKVGQEKGGGEGKVPNRAFWGFHRME